MGFKEDIDRAKAKLEERRADLVQQISEIDVELKDYETALKVARKLTGFAPTVEVSTHAPTISESEPASTQDLVSFTGSKKDLIFKILKSKYPHGLQAIQIRYVASKEYGVSLNPNTLTVSLGRLKNSGSVRIDGRKWFYVPPTDQTKNALPDEKPGRALDLEGSA